MELLQKFWLFSFPLGTVTMVNSSFPLGKTEGELQYRQGHDAGLLSKGPAQQRGYESMYSLKHVAKIRVHEPPLCQHVLQHSGPSSSPNYIIWYILPSRAFIGFASVSLLQTLGSINLCLRCCGSNCSDLFSIPRAYRGHWTYCLCKLSYATWPWYSKS